MSTFSRVRSAGRQSMFPKLLTLAFFQRLINVFYKVLRVYSIGLYRAGLDCTSEDRKCQKIERIGVKVKLRQKLLENIATGRNSHL